MVNEFQIHLFYLIIIYSINYSDNIDYVYNYYRLER